MKMTAYALMDCNNFYASCERVFNPSLKHRPIVILSSNDGCVIARSNEAKAIGIPMGAPYFKYRGLMTQSQTAVFSSNFTLYGDMSARIMSLLPTFTSQFEIYSIDEAFLKLDFLSSAELISHALFIKQQVFRFTGVPVSIGIAPTKTLAKVANYVAKKKTLEGVFSVTNQNVDEMLAALAVDDVWGIGRKLGEKLRQRGIHSALDLKRTPPVLMRRQFSVIVEKIVHELNSYSCLALQDVEPKQSITSSSSFGTKITVLSSLKEAVASHCAKAWAKLRAQGSLASGIVIFLKTSKHDDKQPYYKNSVTLGFDSPLNDTGLMLQKISPAVESLFQEGVRYNKAGVILLGLVKAGSLQQDWVSPSINRDELMQIVDKINTKYQKKTLFYAAEGTQQNWQAKKERKSPHFTTNWKELPIAYAH